MNSLDEYLSEQLQQRERQGTLRSLRTTPENLIDFTSNDYLGLARSEDLRLQIRNKMEIESLPNGATGSRLLSGNSIFHEQLEAYLAELFQAEKTLLFNSGYSANTGVLSCIASRHDTILYDERSHASIKDGVRLSLAAKHPFRHNDLNDLNQKIVSAKGKVFIVVESIYSMDGDSCPLRELVALSEKYDCHIVLDEAHSTGIMGTNGAGFACAADLHDKIAIRIYTFGKAMGSHGACVAGSKVLINYLINFARPFIYTTALPAHAAVALLEAFDFLKSNPGLQKQLHENILYFRNCIDQKSISKSPIQTLIMNSVTATKSKAKQLNEQGFDVRPILSPTVPEGTERLRICLHTFNTRNEIEALATALSKNE